MIHPQPTIILLLLFDDESRASQTPTARLPSRLARMRTALGRAGTRATLVRIMRAGARRAADAPAVIQDAAEEAASKSVSLSAHAASQSPRVRSQLRGRMHRTRRRPDTRARGLSERRGHS